MTKNQKMWLAGGVAAAFVLLVCCAVGVAGYVWWVNPSPERVVDTYLRAVQDRDGEEMRDLTCAAHRDDAEGLDADEDLHGWEVINSEEGTSLAEVRVRVDVTTNGERDAETLDIKLVKEDGDWLVCGLEPV
jgi:hypothetical protein